MIRNENALPSIQNRNNPRPGTPVPGLTTRLPAVQSGPAARVVSIQASVVKFEPSAEIRALSKKREVASRVAFKVLLTVNEQAGVKYPYDDDFAVWLKEHLAGTHLALKGEHRKAEDSEISEIKQQSKDIQKDLEELGKGEDDEKGLQIEVGEVFDKKGKLVKAKPEEISGSLDTFYEAVRDAVTTAIDAEFPFSKAEVAKILVDVSSVEKAASAVVTSIPYLGTAVALFKSVATTVSLGMLAYEGCKIATAVKGSIAAIESKLLQSIQECQKDRGVRLSHDLVGNIANAVSSAVGAGAIVGIVQGIGELIVSVVAKIMERFRIMKINKILQSKQEIQAEFLKHAPLVGLHLPYLDKGMDALTLFGVLPTGWRNSEAQAEHIRDALNDSVKRKQMRKADLEWMQQPIDWTSPPRSASAEKSSLEVSKSEEVLDWSLEISRTVTILENADKYIDAQNWRLYSKTEMIRDPAGFGFKDKLLRNVKKWSDLPPVMSRPKPSAT